MEINKINLFSGLVEWGLLSVILSIGYESGIRQTLELKHIPFPVIMFMVLLFKLLQNNWITLEYEEGMSDFEITIGNLITPFVSLIIISLIYFFTII